MSDQKDPKKPLPADLLPLNSTVDSSNSDSPANSSSRTGSTEGIGGLSTASSVGLSSQGTLPLDEMPTHLSQLDSFEKCDFAYNNPALEMADEPRLAASNRFPYVSNTSINPNPNQTLSGATPNLLTNRFCCVPLTNCDQSVSCNDSNHCKHAANTSHAPLQHSSSSPLSPSQYTNRCSQCAAANLPINIIHHTHLNSFSGSTHSHHHHCFNHSQVHSCIRSPCTAQCDHFDHCSSSSNQANGSRSFPKAIAINDDDAEEEITWTDFNIRNHKFNCGKLFNRLATRTRKQAKHFSLQEQLFTMFPLFDKLRGYNVKKDLVMDIIAGITISILHVPQGIAYSLLIGIPPVYGLYTSFFPVLIYALLGTSSHISVGTMSVLDMMLSQIVRKYHNMNIDDYVYANGTFKGNFTMATKPTDLYSFELGCTEVQLLATLCILVGIFQIVMGIFQMGAISIILSDQLVSAFSCGAAFHVVVSQIPSVLEIKIPTKRDGPFSLFMNIADILTYAPQTKMPALTLSLIVFFVLMIYKEVLDRQVKKFFPLPVPIDLIVVISSTIVSKYMHLAREYSVTVMGEIPTGLPFPELPRMDIVTNDVIQDAFILSMISYAASLSLSKIYAKKHHYTIRANQEFFALGVSNFGSSFFTCFPATASLSRASVMGELSKTQLSSIISCSILLQILLFLAPVLTDLPKCAVGVIIICAQKSLLAQCEEFPKAWKLSRYEGMIWMVTFLSVVCFGIDYGLMAGAVFSVFTIVMRFYHPKLRLLGQIPYTEIYLDIHQHRAAKEVPSVKVIQFTSPLFFINKDMFQEQVLKRTVKNQVFKGAPEGLDYGPVHTLVIDCSAMSFIDSSGVEAIAEIANELQQRKIQVCLAALSPPVISMLTRMHFFEQSPYTLIFPSVHEAVLKSESPLLARKSQN